MPWGQVVKTKSLAFENFRFVIPAKVYRLAMVGTIASLLTTAVIYSRDGSGATEGTEHSSKQISYSAEKPGVIRDVGEISHPAH